LESFVPHAETLSRVAPIYEELPGWGDSLREARRFDQLPANARSYIHFIEQAAGIPVSLVTVGPEREQTVIR
jgi:adenylosuccinate synthase